MTRSSSLLFSKEVFVKYYMQQNAEVMRVHVRGSYFRQLFC